MLSAAHSFGLSLVLIFLRLRIGSVAPDQVKPRLAANCQVNRISMKPMPTHMTMWLASSSHGAMIRPTAPPAGPTGRLAADSSSPAGTAHGIGPEVSAVMGGTLHRCGQSEDGRREEHEREQKADPRIESCTR